LLNLIFLSSIYATALGFSAVTLEIYFEKLCLSNHSQTNSVPVLPFTNPLSGFALAV